MDGSSKIAVAIVAAAVVLAVAYVGYDQWKEYRARSAVGAALEQVSQVSERARQEAVLESQQAQQARIAWDARRRLTGTLRCVGGAVVDVQGNSYRQIGTIADPVHCVGDMADKPLY